MEMMFKLTEGKPPFIGVVFENEKEAELNKDLLDLKLVNFSIMVLDHNRYNISFRLLAEKPLILRDYNNIKVEYDAFKKWRVYSHMKINFGHVIMVNNKPEIVRINKKMFVLPIQYFQIG